jgi:poly-gamma-glutamate synthesis protein (capsule biosynthesis protein)
MALINIIRNADVSFAALESVIHDYEGPETYPAAEAPDTWMRSPRYIADEIKWAGIDLVSHAQNHALDYSYGGLFQSWKALNEAGVVHAGTGKNLGEARAPAYLETPHGRVALVSMCASFTGWMRAGETRADSTGRPGVNPLRFVYVIDRDTKEKLKELFWKMGLYMRQEGRMLLVHPPGLNTTITRFDDADGDVDGMTTVVDEHDAEGNLRSIEEARKQADWVIAQVHNHWTHYDAKRGCHRSAEFVYPFARQCIDAGADVFFEQGGGVLPRGIELYNGKPIIYDTGSFIRMASTVTRQPADFFTRWGYPESLRDPRISVAEGYDAREKQSKYLQPAGAPSMHAPGSVLVRCSYGANRKLTEMKLYPVSVLGSAYSQTDEPRAHMGVPRLADAAKGAQIIDYVSKVSALHGTTIEFKQGVGVVKL